MRPERQFIVGLELSDMHCSNKQGSRTLTFRSTIGLSPLSYARQILVAAALAETAVGELEYPQEGLILKAPHTVTYALDQISRREPPHDLRESEFVVWA